MQSYRSREHDADEYWFGIIYMKSRGIEVEELELPGPKLIHVPFYRDSRGAFCQAYSIADWLDAGLGVDFVQDNYSVSPTPGTLRGMHFQQPPFAQAKLIQVIHGAIFDVSIDLRRKSPTFGEYLVVELQAGSGQLFVPEGFAHGFMSMEPDSIVYYKVTKPYNPASEAGIHWADPDINIPWPKGPERHLLSKKDLSLPNLRDIEINFV
jgi:dTDP-4-dehydrorhamnose 3,5-epimerase